MIVFQESKIQNNLLIWSPTVLRQRSHLGCEFHFSPQKMQTSVTPCHVQEQDHVIVKWCSVTSMDTHCHEHFALLWWTLIMYLTEYFQLIRRGVEGTLISSKILRQETVHFVSLFSSLDSISFMPGKIRITNSLVFEVIADFLGFQGERVWISIVLWNHFLLAPVERPCLVQMRCPHILLVLATWTIWGNDINIYKRKSH